MPVPNIGVLYASLMRDAAVKAADIIARKAVENASSQGLPGEVADAISIGEFRVLGGDIFSIDVEVDLEKAPMARAFELGSGIHATRGGRTTYEIKPTKARALAFEWEPEYIPWGSPKFIGLAGRKYLFRKVDHPGVMRRPFLIPAADETINQVVEIFSQAMLQVASLSFDVVTEP